MHTELATVPDFTLQHHSRQPGDCKRYAVKKMVPVSSRLRAFFATAFGTDRCDVYIRTAIVSFFLLLIFLPIAIFIALLCSTFRQTAAASTEGWFSEVVGVDLRDYSGINHFSDESIGEISHHFRFNFSDPSAVDRIINKHRLFGSPLKTALQNDSQPGWYTPNSVPPWPYGNRFSNEDSDGIFRSLFIDYTSNTAYFVYEDF